MTFVCVIEIERHWRGGEGRGGEGNGRMRLRVGASSRPDQITATVERQPGVRKPSPTTRIRGPELPPRNDRTDTNVRAGVPSDRLIRQWA